MKPKRKLKRELKNLKKEQNRKKPLKFVEALHEVLVKRPSKKPKRNQVNGGGGNSGRMSCRDFGLI
jgi:hypothetical protein